jgi:hypothetical protein
MVSPRFSLANELGEIAARFGDGVLFPHQADLHGISHDVHSVAVAYRLIVVTAASVFRALAVSSTFGAKAQAVVRCRAAATNPCPTWGGWLDR